MTRVFCDRCEKEIKRPFKVYTIISKLYYKRLFMLKNDEETVEHEICKECQESLEKWWQEGK